MTIHIRWYLPVVKDKTRGKLQGRWLTTRSRMESGFAAIVVLESKTERRVLKGGGREAELCGCDLMGEQSEICGGGI